MTDVTAREREIVRDALEGLALAISRSKQLEGDSLSKVSAIKLEKFLYEGMKHEGELGSVTHSWYLAGAKTDVGDDYVSTDQLHAAFQRVADRPSHSSQFADERDSYSANERAKSYADFYTEIYDLDEKWFTPGESFLLDFYRREAPDEYRELYTAVQQLRNVLSETDRKLYKLATARKQDTTLADFGQTTTITGPDRYHEVSTLVSKIHVELATDEFLSETLSAFRQFTDLLEDVFLALSEMSVDRIESEQLQAFKSLKRFHFYEAWRLPALVISRRTAVGPRSDELQRERIRTLDEHQRRMLEKLQKRRRSCAEAALVPTAADYGAAEEDSTTDTDGFLNTYLRRD